MNEAEILSLAYQLRAAGDARSLAAIVAAVRADAAALFTPPPVAADAVIGHHRQVIPGEGGVTVAEFELVGPLNEPREVSRVFVPDNA